jgi:hypothetical protein
MLQPINYAAVKTITRHVFTPFELLLYPIVHWASLPVLAVNLIQSPSLSGPPYNFSPQNVGFTSFAISMGAAIGFLTGGPLSDWIAMRATTRNNGIREPEMRLVALVPFIFITAVGMAVSRSTLAYRLVNPAGVLILLVQRLLLWVHRMAGLGRPLYSLVTLALAFSLLAYHQ